MQREVGELAAAEDSLARALVIAEKAFGPGHPQVARTLGNLGNVQHERGDLAAAEDSQAWALAIFEKAFGPDHPNVAITLTNLGKMQRGLVRTADARKSYARAVAIFAAAAVLQSPADGYSFLVDAANQLTNPVLMRELPFDYRAAFAPVSQIASFPQVIAVRHDFPARTIEEFVAYAKDRPGTVSYGTPPAARRPPPAWRTWPARSSSASRASAWCTRPTAAAPTRRGTSPRAWWTPRSSPPPPSGPRCRRGGRASRRSPARTGWRPTPTCRRWPSAASPAST